MSRTGRPSCSDKIAADDLLINELAVSAAIAAAIEALDVAFEGWHDSVAGETAVTAVEPPLPAAPAARALGGGVPSRS